MKIARAICVKCFSSNAYSEFLSLELHIRKRRKKFSQKWISLNLFLNKLRLILNRNMFSVSFSAEFLFILLFPTRINGNAGLTWIYRTISLHAFMNAVPSKTINWAETRVVSGTNRANPSGYSIWIIVRHPFNKRFFHYLGQTRIKRVFTGNIRWFSRHSFTHTHTQETQLYILYGINKTGTDSIANDVLSADFLCSVEQINTTLGLDVSR